MDSRGAVRVCRPKAAFTGNGLQPWPCCAARRAARRELPPIQMGGCGFWTGTGSMRVSDRRVSRSVPPDAGARPGAFHREQRVVGELVAATEVRSQRVELRLQIARGDTQDHPPAGDRIQARDGVRREEGIAVGQHQDVRVQAQSLRRRGGDGESHERVEGVVAARSQPGVRRKRMLGHVARVEIRGFQRTCEFMDGRRADQLGVLRDPVRRDLPRELHPR